MNGNGQLGFLACATVLWAGCYSPQPVQAFSLTLRDTNQASLEFFDSAGSLLGSGSITYQPFSGSFAQTLPSDVVYQTPENTDPLNGNHYIPPSDFLQITSFSVDFTTGGVSLPAPGTTVFDLNTTGHSIVSRNVYFWNPPAADVTSSATNLELLTVLGGDPRSPGLQTRSYWSGCLPVCGTGQKSTYMINPNGTWSFFGMVPANSGSSGFLSLRGTWQAKVIADPGGIPVPAPEPTTTAGSLVAMSSLLVWKLKYRRRRNP